MTKSKKGGNNQNIINNIKNAVIDYNTALQNIKAIVINSFSADYNDIHNDFNDYIAKRDILRTHLLAAISFRMNVKYRISDTDDLLEIIFPQRPVSIEQHFSNMASSFRYKNISDFRDLTFLSENMYVRDVLIYLHEYRTLQTEVKIDIPEQEENSHALPSTRPRGGKNNIFISNKMKYEVSENGKYFYKVAKDGKKSRIPKDEYMKKTRKSKKVGGNNSVLDYAIIIGAGGNLSPVIQNQLNTNNLTLYDGTTTDIKGKYAVFGSKEYDLTKEASDGSTPGGIKELSEMIKLLIPPVPTDGSQPLKGAVIFVAAQRDPMMFDYCKDEATYAKYRLDKKNPTGQITNHLEKQKQLWNLNVKAPIDIFDSIADNSNMTFVYISTIYVFKGTQGSPVRTEDITSNTLDFIEVDTNKNIDYAPLFVTKGKDLYAYGKRYVELHLNSSILAKTPTGLGGMFSSYKPSAKVIILRMDGITPEKATNVNDGTFLLALSTPTASFNVAEVRYPVFPIQISNVIMGAISKQTEPLKVYHVCGTEKEKGLTKAEMILHIKSNTAPELIPIIAEKLRTQVKTDRKMDDSKALEVASNYADIGKPFMILLKEVYDGIEKKGGRGKRR